MFFRVAVRPVLGWLLFVFVLARTTDCYGWQLSSDAAFEILGGDVLTDNLLEVRQRAMKLNADGRFEFLARWVLPGESHPGYRMAGIFTETRPTFAARNVQPFQNSGSSDSNISRIVMRSSAGPELVSPVFDLLDAAVTTGKLDELRDRILALPQARLTEAEASDVTSGASWNRLQDRSRNALLLLIELKRNVETPPSELFDEFYESTLRSAPQSTRDRWPETLIAWFCARRPPRFRGTGELLELLWSKRAIQPTSGEDTVWQLLIASLLWRQRFRSAAANQESNDQTSSDESLQDRWITTSRVRAHTRGRGHPNAEWRRSGHEVHHVSGHDEDYLLYRIPLRGNYSVEAELLAPGEAQLLVAGTVFGPRGSKGIITGKFNTGAVAERITPPLAKIYDWVFCRSVVENGQCRTYLNGRLVNQRSVGDNPDPWVGIRSWCLTAGAVRDVRITGDPEIPESVVISDPACRSGWVAYHENSAKRENARWSFTQSPDHESIITGVSGSEPAGSLRESLLRYFRPLIEDGSIEYDFYYEPDRVIGHPALGRHVFLLEPDGVRVHTISNGPYDRAVSEPEELAQSSVPRPDRSSARSLPLRNGAWNRLRLAIAEHRLSISVNGAVVFESLVDLSCSRHFGLFHFNDLTELRVRDVTMRGDWPQKLQPITKQVLVDPEAIRFDKRLREFEPAFVHDFRKGLPVEYFTPPRSTSLHRLLPTGNGVIHAQRSSGKYVTSAVDSKFRLVRDFDVMAEFSNQTVSKNNKGGCGLHVIFDQGYSVDVRRRWQSPDLHSIYVQWKYPSPKGTSAADVGKPVKVFNYLATEANSGRIRIARRKDTMSVLFAENDSSEFRVVASKALPGIGSRTGTARISLLATDSGTSTVTWKQFRAAAEELLITPASIEKRLNRLFVMNADGSGLKQITKDIPSAMGLGHGSPDWSSTGEFLAFDAWSGRGDTTRAFLVKPDGSDLRDLGNGVMPSFTHDGRRVAVTWGFKGLATISLKGGDRKIVSPTGWSGKCSPDGKWMVYEVPRRVEGRQGWNLVVINLKTGKKRDLLTGQQRSRYSRAYFNMAWSPDSRQVVFKGDLAAGGSETAMVSVDGSSKGFRVLTTLQTGNNFGWHPDGDRILMIRRSSAHSGNRLFDYDLQTKDLTLYEGQPLEYTINHGIWSPDGRQIAFSGWKPLTAERWKPAAK